MSAHALTFDCAGETLVGILERAERPRSTGVLIVVGGPQYRAGSHRQFVLLARALAEAGYPVLRFDYSGMGDSTGQPRSFESIGPDLRAAVDGFFRHERELDNVVLWGLCDAASASLFYAYRDPRVAGLVLTNPWIRTEAGEARAYLKHYYLERFMSREFWMKLVSGGFNIKDSVLSLVGYARRLRRAAHKIETPGQDLSGTLPERMAQSWRRFERPMLLLLSGEDLTAQEFLDTTRNSSAWTGLLESARVTRHAWPEANHTFSSRAWRDAVAAVTIAWLDGVQARHQIGGPSRRRTAT